MSYLKPKHFDQSDANTGSARELIRRVRQATCPYLLTEVLGAPAQCTNGNTVLLGSQ